jgi:hypothetical protein
MCQFKEIGPKRRTREKGRVLLSSVTFVCAKERKKRGGDEKKLEGQRSIKVEERVEGDIGSCHTCAHVV